MLKLRVPVLDSQPITDGQACLQKEFLILLQDLLQGFSAEGSEYSILKDMRFSKLDISVNIPETSFCIKQGLCWSAEVEGGWDWAQWGGLVEEAGEALTQCGHLVGVHM